MATTIYGRVPNIFHYYTARYPYILSPHDLFELVTGVAYHQGVDNSGWSIRLNDFAATVPPSYAIANPDACKRDYEELVLELFSAVIKDESYLTYFYQGLFDCVGRDQVLVSMMVSRRGEFTLTFDDRR